MEKIGELSEVKGEITVEWKITDFSKLSDKIDACYKSSKFYFSSASWEMWIYPNGQKKCNSDGWLDLYILRMSAGCSIMLKYSLSLKIDDVRTLPTRTDTGLIEKNRNGWGGTKLIERTGLTEKLSIVKPVDTLIVTCTLKNSDPNAVADSYFIRLQDVSDNLKEIHNEGYRSDLTLNVSGENIRAHRMILETRSAVFAAMFNNDTQEKQTGEVFIDDLEKTAVDAIIGFIYTGDIDELTTENAMLIYGAAEKYDIKVVKEMCVQFILHNMSVEWFSDIIEFVGLYAEEEVDLHARDYFKDYSGEILQSDKWKSFVRENPNLVLKFLTLF